MGYSNTAFFQKEYEFPDEKGKGHSTEVLNQAFVIYEEEESVVITGRTETAVRLKVTDGKITVEKEA